MSTINKSKTNYFLYFLPESIFPPVFGRRLQAQVVKRGDRVIMDVEVTGTPDPTVTWMKDDKPIKEALTGSFRIQQIGICHKLILDSAKLDDAGRYMVRATNAGGEAQSIADFAVYEPEPQPIESVKRVVFEDMIKQVSFVFLLISFSNRLFFAIFRAFPIFNLQNLSFSLLFQ